eukprot:Polyplicarium_translucidae@DN2217_c1_g1_i1.p1
MSELRFRDVSRFLSETGTVVEVVPIGRKRCCPNLPSFPTLLVVLFVVAAYVSLAVAGFGVSARIASPTILFELAGETSVKEAPILRYVPHGGREFWHFRMHVFDRLVAFNPGFMKASVVDYAWEVSYVPAAVFTPNGTRYPLPSSLRSSERCSDWIATAKQKGSWFQPRARRLEDQWRAMTGLSKCRERKRTRRVVSDREVEANITDYHRISFPFGLDDRSDWSSGVVAQVMWNTIGGEEITDFEIEVIVDAEVSASPPDRFDIPTLMVADCEETATLEFSVKLIRIRTHAHSLTKFQFTHNVAWDLELDVACPPDLIPPP